MRMLAVLSARWSPCPQFSEQWISRRSDRRRQSTRSAESEAANGCLRCWLLPSIFHPSIPRYPRKGFLSSMYKRQRLVSEIHKWNGTISARSSGDASCDDAGADSMAPAFLLYYRIAHRDRIAQGSAEPRGLRPGSRRLQLGKHVGLRGSHRLPNGDGFVCQTLGLIKLP